MRYVSGRGELGVLSFEPYKSHLLPLWRFKTPDLARESAAQLEREFARFVDEGDFVGADMARKFLQMGMTRSLRYANRAGGRKYAAASAAGGGQAGTLLPKSDDHPGAAAKRESAAVFREVWERCKEREEYKRLRREWEVEKKDWEKSGGAKKGEEQEQEGGKQEDEEVEELEDVKATRGKKRTDTDVQEKAPDARAKRRRRVKQESSDEYEDDTSE
ncbi:hypothetical protein Rhopal_007599-T1 [Rhodotorula paludigena]|uniref:Uncharacterized protein n=1 Tax=Rhodotorula paludigena TaxID=86838 RepID=A0AAV5GPJ4_9BASI|nr:hypothetical protein Rhopal_007599-T1 [Rhodotorula paludigena]